MDFVEGQGRQGLWFHVFWFRPERRESVRSLLALEPQRGVTAAWPSVGGRFLPLEIAGQIRRSRTSRITPGRRFARAT